MMGIKDSNQLLISKGCNTVTLHGNMVANQDSSDKKIIKLSLYSEKIHCSLFTHHANCS